jgi:type III pantothenate kinase
MILLLDWGNSRLKFCLLEKATDESLKDANSVNLADMDELKQSSVLNALKGKITVALVASVKSKQDNLVLGSWLKTLVEQVIVVKTSQQAFGVSCAYQQYQTLGIDRWLGIVACAKQHRSFGVISIGTAITLDVVVDNQHIGGHILPGRQLMYQSLFSTGQVRPKQSQVSHSALSLGQSTTECVNFALDAAIASYTEQMIRQFSQQYPISHWSICGGGSQAVFAQLKSSDIKLEHKPQLVFQGLLRYLEK